MSLNTFKILAYLVLTAAGPVAVALLKVDPAWNWLALVPTIAGQLLSALHVDGIAATRKLAVANDKIDSLTLGRPQVVPPVTITTLAAFALLLGCIAASAGQSACTPAQFAELKAVEQIVASDIAAGKTKEQIVADVCNALGGSNGVCTATVDGLIVLDDALALLIDTGVLPPNILGRARSMAAEVHPMALAHRMAH